MKSFRVITATLLIAWMVLIFCLSAQNATESSGTSGSLIGAVVEIFYPEFKELSIAEQQEIISPFQFIVRKGAHFSLYAVLGILSFFTFVTYNKFSLKARFLSSVLVCSLYAVSDEVHQLFVAGRSCEFRDMLIDFCGAILGITVALLLSKTNMFKRKFKAVLI